MTLSQTLFDDIPRSYKGPANRSEPSFDYLNRSARLDVDRVRHVFGEWFSHFPTAAQPDLCSRFRSKDDRQHLGTFFELYLHELLCRFQADPRFVAYKLDGVNLRRRKEITVPILLGAYYAAAQ